MRRRAKSPAPGATPEGTWSVLTLIPEGSSKRTSALPVHATYWRKPPQDAPQALGMHLPACPTLNHSQTNPIPCLPVFGSILSSRFSPPVYDVPTSELKIVGPLRGEGGRGQIKREGVAKERVKKKVCGGMLKTNYLSFIYPDTHFRLARTAQQMVDIETSYDILYICIFTLVIGNTANPTKSP